MRLTSWTLRSGSKQLELESPTPPPPPTPQLTQLESIAGEHSWNTQLEHGRKLRCQPVSTKQR
jgi:hypothetical protein